MKRKIILMLLTIVSCICLAFGISACGTSEDGSESSSDVIDVTSSAETSSEEDAWGTVYTAEAAYKVATSLGYTGTLEEFIASISGTNGVGISSVALNAKGELVVTLSDTTTVNLGVIKGEDGEDGSVWYVASGAPASTTGKDGDMYLDTATYNIYQKSSGAWTKVGTIKGTDGEDGALWYVESGVPASTTGSNGDMYLDTATYDIYQKADGAWTKIGNIGGEGTSSETEYYTLTFDANGGTVTSQTMLVEKGSCADLPVPEKEGYAFSGWYYGSGANAGQVTDVTPITRSMTLTAKWERAYEMTVYCDSTITYAGNGCSFYAYYGGTFSDLGYNYIDITITVDGTDYTIDEAIDSGYVSEYYVYNMDYTNSTWVYDSESENYIDYYYNIEGWISFDKTGEYTVTLSYSTSSVSYDITVSNFNYYFTTGAVYTRDAFDFDVSYYGDEDFEYPLITVTGANYSYVYTCGVENEDDDTCTVVLQNWNGSCVRGCIYFAVAGDYTVTVSYGEDSISKNVSVTVCPTYIRYIDTDAEEESYDEETGTAVEADITVYYGIGLSLRIYGSNLQLSITLNGTALVAGTDYELESYTNYCYVYLGTDQFTEDEVNVINITATGDNGTATAAINATVENFLVDNQEESTITEFDFYYYDVYYLTYTACSHATIEIADTAGAYSYTYTISADGMYYDNGESVTSIENTCMYAYYEYYYYDNLYQYNVYGDICFLNAGTYVVTVTFGEDSISFEIIVEEYEYEGGEVTLDVIEYTSDSGQEISVSASDSLTTTNVTINGDELSYYYFIPVTDGYITIFTESSLDTYGYLYIVTDANEGEEELLTSNDDGDNNTNFSITWYVEANNLYMIGVRGYNSGVSGSAILYLSGVQVAFGTSAGIEVPDPEEEETLTITDYNTESFNNIVIAFVAPRDATVDLTVNNESFDGDEIVTFWYAGILYVYITPKGCTDELAAGTYAMTVTVSSETYGEASVSFNYVIAEVTAYVGGIVAGDSTFTYGSEDTAVEENFTIYTGESTRVTLYMSDAEISVTLGGEALTPDTDYLVESTTGEYGVACNVITIYTGTYEDGEYTIVVTATSGESTLTATLNVTITSFNVISTPSSYLSVGSTTTFYVYYYGDCTEEYYVTIVDENGSSEYYTINYIYAWDGDVWCSYYISQEGTYTVTLYYGSSSISFVTYVTDSSSASSSSSDSSAAESYATDSSYTATTEAESSASGELSAED